MDERSINGAAIAAISDLELDCEIKDVCQNAGRDAWCIQFSGKYGQFCDDFKNQFGKENSPRVIREKIKSHLLKQVSKIRSSTGRRRKPATSDALEQRESASDLLAAPLKLVQDVFNRAAGVTGEVVSRASDVAESARDAVADLAGNISPVTIEVHGTTRVAEEKASGSSRRKTIRPTRASSKRTKATKRVEKRAGKQAKKAGKASSKTAKKRKAKG